MEGPKGARWRSGKPEDKAWRPRCGLTPRQRTREQDEAAGGRDRRLVPLPGGRTALGSVALRVQPDGRRIYAYLRWSDAGRTTERYIGEVGQPTRRGNLAEAWRLTHERGLTGQAASASAEASADPAKGISWASSPAVRSIMRGNKGRDTRPEKALRSAVHALGLRYRVNARPIPGLRRSADLVFTRVKVAVFLDGCFWHGCPEHHRAATKNAEFWRAKIEGNRTRDAETDRVLAEHGWTVVRIWEHDDPLQSAARIAELTRTRRDPGSVRGAAVRR
jgi:DNA mismatch endonuclease (patch repair protein)